MTARHTLCTLQQGILALSRARPVNHVQRVTSAPLRARVARRRSDFASESRQVDSDVRASAATSKPYSRHFIAHMAIKTNYGDERTNKTIISVYIYELQRWSKKISPTSLLERERAGESQNERRARLPSENFAETLRIGTSQRMFISEFLSDQDCHLTSRN
jgi:ribosomal protein S24E